MGACDYDPDFLSSPPRMCTQQELRDMKMTTSPDAATRMLIAVLVFAACSSKKHASCFWGSLKGQKCSCKVDQNENEEQLCVA